jgi:hypothetical protein
MRIVLLVLALGGCASEKVAPADRDVDLAAMACAGVTDFAKWQLCKYDFNQLVEATARDFRAAQRKAPSVATQPISEPPMPAPIREAAPQRVAERETDRNADASQPV